MNNFWKRALIDGGLLGLVASAFYLVEQVSMLNGRIMLMGFVWMIAAVLYVMLLVRFAKRLRASEGEEKGFSFGKAFGFLLMLVAVGSVVKGFVQWLYTNVVMGYSTYADRVIEALMGYFDRNGGIPASVQPMVDQSIQTLQAAPAPTLVGTIWSVLFANVIFCGMVSLIIAAIVKRDVKLG